PPAAAAANPAGGGGRGGGYNWCNNAGPGGGFGGRGGGGGGGAAAQQPAAPRVVPPLDPKQGGVLRSENKGQTWTLVSNCNSRPMYFSQLRVDPSNDKTIYVAGMTVAKSLDGGKTIAPLAGAGGNTAQRTVETPAIRVDAYDL